MKLGILYQLLWQKKTKTVSDSRNSFIGQKMANFALKMVFLANFGMIEGSFGGKSGPILAQRRVGSV